MPKSKKAKGVMQSFKSKYGKKKGEEFFYASANKQNRDPDTFRKEFIERLDAILEAAVSI